MRKSRRRQVRFVGGELGNFLWPHTFGMVNFLKSSLFRGFTWNREETRNKNHRVLNENWRSGVQLGANQKPMRDDLQLCKAAPQKLSSLEKT